jgi:hypothetical protein
VTVPLAARPEMFVARSGQPDAESPRERSVLVNPGARVSLGGVVPLKNATGSGARSVGHKQVRIR